MRPENLIARFRTAASRLRGFFSSRRLDRDFQDELSAHLSMLEDENLRRGLAPDEARRQARLRLGAEVPLRESHHDLRGLPWLESLLQDVRFGLRMLRKSPGFTAVAILTLALGIGANTAIFSVVNAVLLQPLPFKNPSRLVLMSGGWLQDPGGGYGSLSPRDFLDYRSQNSTFKQLAAEIHGDTIFNLALRNRARQVIGRVVTSNFFKALGIRPLLGRSFVASDEAASDPRVAILSHRMWKEDFAGSSNVIGRSLDLDGQHMTVVGVVPDIPLFQAADLWLPVPFENAGMETRLSHFLSPIGLLKPGVSLEKADADLAVVTSRIEREYPDFSHYGWHVYVVPLQEALVGNAREGLLILVGIVGLVLLVACANVASLLLARNTYRQREIAVRKALGGPRLRLVRQILTETSLLAVGGGAVGICLAYCGVELLRKLGPSSLPRLNEVTVSTPVLVFTAAVCLLSGILFGLGPALQASRQDVTPYLKGSRPQGQKSRGRAQNVLVVAQFAVSFVVLIACGLLLHTFWRIVHVQPGFDPNGVVTTDISITGTDYGSAQRRVAFVQAVEDRVRAIPGVQSAGFISELPLSGRENDTWFTTKDHPPTRPSERYVADSRVVAGNYFETMQIPLLSGRRFSRSDANRAPKVVIVNEPLVHAYFSGANPVGNRLEIFNGHGFTLSEIIGVVGGDKESALQQPSQAEIFAPYPQAASLRMTLVVRSRRDPLALASAIRDAVHGVDPAEATSAFRSLSDVVSTSQASERFEVILLSTFGAVALLLAASGVFATQSYLVAEQTHDIGIRVTLGAQRRHLFALVLRKGIALASLGACIGVVAALLLAHFMQALLYRVSPTDPLTFASAVLMQIAVALVASYVPARRASRLDPMAALRHE